MIVLIIIIVLVLCAIFGKGSPPPAPKKDYYAAAKRQQNVEANRRTTHTKTSEVRVSVDVNPIISKKMDESIIDVGGSAIKIDQDYGLPASVPYWDHSYVYSYNELAYATKTQKEFYRYYKSKFLDGVYLDIEGNTNYAFILMFDLLNNFDTHRDISKLESQLEQLGLHYPRTKSYGIDFLIKKMQTIGDSEGISRLREDHYSYESNITYSTFEWRNKYKKLLGLKKDETNLMDKIWFSINTFNSIEYCCIEIINLYLETIATLQRNYGQMGTTVEKQFEEVADIVVRKHFNYRKGSNNYKYGMQSCENEIYTCIFKLCENAVRDFYGNKRKITIDAYNSTPEARAEFESKILNEAGTIIAVLRKTVKDPDPEVEIKLNRLNTTRWKFQFENIVNDFGSNAAVFAEKIFQLGNLNGENPSVENIFFEASKFIAKTDKTIALSLYIRYLYHDMKSATFDNKQLTKTIQKSLFKTEEQLTDFQKIVDDFMADKDLDKALNEVPRVYTLKRKKIRLDPSTINDVKVLHSGTVELLNEYLKEEELHDNDVQYKPATNDDEIEIRMNQKDAMKVSSIYLAELPLRHLHLDTLEIFSKNNFSILQSEFESFAKSNGAFSNQLIESINDICFEKLDDLLIEEDEDYFTINQNYYQKLLA